MILPALGILALAVVFLFKTESVNATEQAKKHKCTFTSYPNGDSKLECNGEGTECDSYNDCKKPESNPS